MENSCSPDELRARLTDDLAAGKTVVLSASELDDPSLRQQLPQLLEELAGRHQPFGRGGPDLPGYTMLGEIGQGGMSTVYLARQETLGRHVAVKIAPKWLGGGERATARLVQEAQAMARVKHPNIVVIHDIIDFDDTFAIAMEWVDGRTLAGLLRPLPIQPTADDMSILRAALGAREQDRDKFDDTAARFFVRKLHDIARATQSVHDAGLLHLDIKPSNVLVRRDGTALLADFGVVREIAADLTQTRTFAGTPIYAAPEQLRRRDSLIGPATDVYGLGLTLYEALARSQPLQGMDLPAILHCVEHGQMPRLSGKTVISRDLENIVHKAIAPEVANRYPSAAAFADDLLAFLEHRPVTARPLTRVQRLRRWARNEPWKAALAAALSVMVPTVIGLVTYLLSEMPNIRQLRANERLAQANRLAQEAYQLWLTGARDEDECANLLQRSMTLDPGDSSLACLVAMVNEHGYARAIEVLDQHPEAVDRVLGLRLFRQKALDRRSFFDEHEVALLDASSASIDKFVLALDRVFWADDAGYEEAYADAQTRLEAAVIAGGPDPLLLGLQTWTSLRAMDRPRFDATCAALRMRWPDDVVVLAWTGLSQEQRDRAAAERIAEELIQMAPEHARGYEMIIGSAFRANQPDRVSTEVERARKAGVASPAIEGFRLASLARQGDEQAAALALASLPKSVVGVRRWLDLSGMVEPQARQEWIDDLLANDRASPHALSILHAVASAESDLELTTSAWRRHRELYRDRRLLHVDQMRNFYEQRQLEAAAELARETLLPARAVDAISPFLTRIFLADHDWQHLFTCCERWLRLGKGDRRQEAAYYAGLAKSRLGEYAASSELFATALNREVPDTVWYVTALLEDAWLRCTPAAPPQLRDPEMAKLRLDRFEQLNTGLTRPIRGAWTLGLRAEIEFANGRRDVAVATVERALAARRAEPHAPLDWRDRLQAALERYRQ